MAALTWAAASYTTTRGTTSGRSKEKLMRYSEEYLDWAARAENGPSPSDRERASLTAAKIRDNLSSQFDAEQLVRMERLAGGRIRQEDDGAPSRTLPAAKREPKAAAHCGTLELSFSLEGCSVRILVHQAELRADRLERLIASEIACRNDLDLSINGFEPGSRLTQRRFRARLKVADFDYEAGCDVNERTVEIDASLSSQLTIGWARASRP